MLNKPLHLPIPNESGAKYGIKDYKINKYVCTAENNKFFFYF